MKLAVIKTGGKQYTVNEGDVITIEKLGDEMSVGDEIVFDEVLMTDDGSKAVIGAPMVSGAKVKGKLVEQGKGKKIRVLRFRSKSRYHRTYGHRQPFMKVEITSV